MFFTILIVFFSIIGLLALHEFGHFVVAKRLGVKVEEFGLGYPPRIFGRKMGETVYSLNLLPFGAFVKILGEEGEENVESQRSFSNRPFWQRVSIIVGGVVSFWLAAVILLTAVFIMGVPEVISDDEQANLINPKVQILSVASQSPAEEAGIEMGDTIIKVKSQKSEVKSVDRVIEVQDFTEENRGEEVILTIQRGNKAFDVFLVPRVSPPKNEGAMGVALVRTAEKSYSIWQAPLMGVERTANLTGQVVIGWVQILKSLIGGEGLPQGVKFVGPIGIGTLLTQAVQVGINYFLQFIAIIAVYLAVLNILPIPALDGGKLLFLFVEKIKGRPINQRIEQKITGAFFIMLLMVMVWVTIKDIVNLF